jgi:competence protein CoiA
MEPSKGLKGVCPGCGKDVIAKCGNVKVHHWAHVNIKDCDSWHEPETEWHREWKNKFPIDFREKPFIDEISGEIHRADIHTSNGVTIEFQNSPISLQELRSRNGFYKSLIWVVNARKFKGQFKFENATPDPYSDQLKDYDFAGGPFAHFFRRKDLTGPDSAYELINLNHRELQHIQKSNEFWLFTWKHAHTVWYDSISPVFLDFGDEFLYWLKKREQINKPMWFIQIVRKDKFIEKYSR